jgi:hypothetical protein
MYYGTKTKTLSKNKPLSRMHMHDKLGTEFWCSTWSFRKDLFPFRGEKHGRSYDWKVGHRKIAIVRKLEKVSNFL